MYHDFEIHTAIHVKSASLPINPVKQYDFDLKMFIAYL